MPGGEQRGERRPDGTFLPGNSTKAQNWKPGESGNKSGMPKGYLAPALRLQKKFGRQEDWERLERALDSVLDQTDDEGRVDAAAVNALLKTIVGNDHALAKTGEDDKSTEQSANFIKKPVEESGDGGDD